MTAILRLESRKRVRGSVALVVVFGLISAMYFSMFPGIEEELDELMEGFPDFFFEIFGIEALDTIEGFIAAEVYSFFWVVLLAIYFAYVGAGMITADVRSRRMDLTLSNPVSRESVILQKAAAFWVPIVVLNVAVPIIVYVGAQVIGESIDPVALAMVHVLSIPYLLVCGAIGLTISSFAGHVRSARAGAITIVFVLWLIDGFSRLDEDLEWIGGLTPSRYYEETDILVHEEFAFVDAGILLVVFAVLLAIAVVVFTRRDI